MLEKTKEENTFPIIGIGASAGGLESFKQFFSIMPADCGMAFVLVPHLDPTHESILCELIMKYTHMMVKEVIDSTKIEQNKIYIISPQYDMTISHNKLYLTKISVQRGLRLPIDHFFRSLSKDQKDKAICILFSGTGSDGTLGLRAIKGLGGMAMVQDPISAKYDGMLKSAISNAVVDYILPPDKMPEQLLKYVKKRVSPLKKNDKLSSNKLSDYIVEILDLLKTRTNHDFSVYKENTILRRIERRIVINHFSNISAYLNYITDHPHEIEILFKELLIGVTNFFRDKEAYAILEENVILILLKKAEKTRKLRIWVPGCSTGEEAYSIAILFQEHIEKLNLDIKLQVFATDIDNIAIDKARLGIYLDNITADISPERIEKNFSSKGNFYQVKKRIRNKVVFAVQNVISDPPFSKVDLISCRNLLIYLNAEIQKKLLLLFHYSLNADGFLFLGHSESINSIPTFFSEINRKWKIFQRNEVPYFLPDTSMPFPPLINYTLDKRYKDGLSKRVVTDYRQILEKFLLKNYSPPSVIISEKGDILYINGQINTFLEIQSGEAKMNIFQMATDEIKYKLSSILRDILTKSEEVKHERILIKSGNDKVQLNLTVIPILKPISLKGLFIILFEEIALKKSTQIEMIQTEPYDRDQDQRVKQLEEELISAKQYLQTTIEELETTNEELQSSNEELQSSNEELQSTNEEIQTSKEELQSVNEELSTMNDELESKITELKQINDDMRNLMISSNIGTIFLNEDLIIQRFTPASKEIFNLIETDIGRPLTHISTNLIHDDLAKDALKVLETLIPIETDVQIKDNGWFNMRILPYRTEENLIRGTVITFLDINQRYLLEIEKSEALQFVDDIVETVRNPLMVLSKDLKIMRVNKAFFEFFKIDSNEVYDKYIYDIGNKQWDIPKLRTLLSNIIGKHSIIKDYEVQHEFNNIGKRIMYLNAKEMVKENNESLILLAIEDVTEQKGFEKKLLKSKEKFQEAFNHAEFLNDLFTHDMNNILQVILYSSEIISQDLDKPANLEQTTKLNKIILDQINKAQNLIGNIQLISKFEKDTEINHPAKINDILEACVTYIKKAFRNKDLNINIKRYDKKLQILTNELINGVIENILINAIKHNNKEKINIDINISIQILDTVKYVKIEFKDYGPGIKDEIKTKLFSKTFKRSSVGLGIGLSIVQRIVESIHGKIWVEDRIANDYSKGCNFILLLPEAN